MFLRRSGTGVTVELRAQPRARRSALACSQQGTLKAAVTAPAEDGNPNDPRAWVAAAETVAGSWWPHYSDWLTARSGDDRKSRPRPGRKGFEVLAAAPGTYVHDR